MTNRNSQSRFAQIIIWSTISAAFIGPGTVTTALNAGTNFGFSLLWAVSFSIIACYVLQETVSRITIATGFSLGKAINLRARNIWRINIHTLLVIVIIFGCTAYQAGNLVGAAKGIQLISGLSSWKIILAIYIISAFILYLGKTRIIAGILASLVLLMVIIFGYTVIKADLLSSQLIKSALIPGIPPGSSLIIIALIGTTIVPYNLFIGSSLSQGKDLLLTRIGLFISIVLGGIITSFILLTGSVIDGPFSFEKLADYLSANQGNSAVYGLGIGLFSAGFTSALTAPFAASLTYESLNKDQIHSDKKFKVSDWVWFLVLTFGAMLGLLNYSPIAIIILAQAFNGIILPFIAVYIFLIINDSSIIKEKYQNGFIYNLLTFVIIMSSIFLGLYHFSKVLIDVIYIPGLIDYHLAITSGLTLAISMLVLSGIIRRKSVP